MVGGLLGLKPETRKLLALVLVVILSRKVIHLELRVGIFLGGFLGSQEAFLWLQVVIVVELHLPGTKAPLRNPAVKMLLGSFSVSFSFLLLLLFCCVLFSV